MSGVLRSSRRTATGRSRRGIGVVLALACVLLTSAVSGSLVRSTLLQLQQTRRELWREQARWLALSAENRAAALLRARSDFRGDVWQVRLWPDGKNERTGTARTTVEVVSGQPKAKRVVVTATFPTNEDNGERFEHSVVVLRAASADRATPR